MTSEKGVGQVPEGTVDEVKEWVGDDPRRAKKALKEENKSDSPRSTLVTALEALIPEKDEDDDAPAEAEESEEGSSEEAEDGEEDEEADEDPDEESAEDGPEGFDEELDDPDEPATGYENDADAEGEEGKD